TWPPCRRADTIRASKPSENDCKPPANGPRSPLWPSCESSSPSSTPCCETTSNGPIAKTVAPHGRYAATGRIWTESVAGQDAVHQLLHCRGEVVGVERIIFEPVCRVAGEHQVAVHIVTMGDVL